MHELALSRAILNAALTHAEGRPVTSVAVSVGALRQVVPDSLTFNFSVISRGTLCEEANLDMRLVPARLSCDCGESWTLQEPVFLCPACGSGGASVVDGDQLCVDYIEVEEDRCIEPR
jgi:hydrogenase nickel incorporation protein HypA/HybF